MSGKPSIDGVQKFRVHISNLSIAAERISILTSEIGHRQVELERQQEIYRVSKKAFIELMEQMDIEASGNTGWEDRIAWFFSEICRQLRQETK